MGTSWISPRHCEERSDEAIRAQFVALDCFRLAVLGVAMTDQFAWMLADLMISPHFLRSASISLPNSSGVLLMSVMPDSPTKRCIDGCLSALTTSACSSLTMSGGVPAGAIRPNHDDACQAGRPASADVGTSGRAASRCGPAT